MKKSLKGFFTLLLAVVLVFGASPLQGFAGLDFHMPKWLNFSGFSLKAEAAGYSGKCGDNVNWALDTVTGVLNITGTGDMADYDCNGNSYTPWYEYRDSILAVSIGDGVTGIGRQAFVSCGNLTAVTLPGSLTSIGQESFYSCSKLANIAIPPGVTVICSWPFSGCSSLESVTFNAVNCADLNEGLFDSCKALTTVTIGSGVKTIPAYLFAGCTGITTITVPESVERIGDWAFFRCSALATITIPDTVTSIGDSAFSKCGMLKILCHENSYACAYAISKWIEYELLIVPVSGITVNQTAASRLTGETLQLSAAVSPSNATNKGVAWSSSDTGTATVSSAGLVTATAIGEAVITCTAKDGSGVFASCTVTVMPAAPVEVKTSSYTYNAVQISWKAVPGATAYDLYRYNPATAVYEKYKSTSNTYLYDTGLITGKAYYYKVKAYTKFGIKNIYGNLSASVKAIPVPSAPVAPKAVSASYNSIKISWTAVAGATGYTVYRYNPSTKLYDKLKTVASAGFTDTGLVTGREYAYFVKAYRTVNAAAVYGSQSGTVKAKPVPGTPGSFKAVRASSSSAKTSWAAVSGASGYVVYRYNPATDAFEWIKATTSLSYTETKLVTWRAYYYKITAYRTVNGVNIYGKPTAVYGVSVTPDAPGSVKAVSTSATSIKISWSKVSGATGYVIYFYDSNKGEYYAADTTTSTSYDDRYLMFGQTCRYKIRAYKIVNGAYILTGFSAAVTCKATKPLPKIP